MDIIEPFFIEKIQSSRHLHLIKRKHPSIVNRSYFGMKS